MPISVVCPDCRATAKAPDAAAGHVLKCPRCGGNVCVPGSEFANGSRQSVTAAPAPVSWQRRIMSAINLRLGLVIIAAGVLLVGITGAVAVLAVVLLVASWQAGKDRDHAAIAAEREAARLERERQEAIALASKEADATKQKEEREREAQAKAEQQ